MSSVEAPAGPQDPEDPRTAGPARSSDLSDSLHAGLSGYSDTSRPRILSTSAPKSDASDHNHDRRDESLDVRLTRAEKTAVRGRASALRVKPSAWARETLLDALDARRDGVAALEVAASVPAPDPQIGECVEELRRIGQNLNQEVRRGHKRGGDAESLARLLGETIKKVDDLRAALGDRTAV